jgi:hypothetical protein
MSESQIQARVAAWEAEFQRRAMFWTGDCGVRAADVVLQIPELVKLLTTLRTDARLPQNVRDEFATVTDAVMRGIDFLPDDNTSLVALLTDATRLAQVTEAHLHHLDDAGSLAQVVDYILHQQDDYSPRC